ncbi:hypothetical protein F2P44_21695 [Massilia sp. CCM 8695]|uniref:Uncharacterized protein n=1 Tax=Massilia frigida TaxID=2609281 RepID=A0ABX0NFZ0_9BURK|nr:hypothetical protein [Massilia frigida]NHZ81869.1 hypothetical protein [Massilia frigida]
MPIARFVASMVALPEPGCWEYFQLEKVSSRYRLAGVNMRRPSSLSLAPFAIMNNSTPASGLPPGFAIVRLVFDALSRRVGVR